MNWSIEDGSLVAEGGAGGWIVSNSTFQDYELSLKVRQSPKSTTGIAVRAALEGHSSENGTGVMSNFTFKGTDRMPLRDVVVARISADGKKEFIRRATADPATLPKP